MGGPYCLPAMTGILYNLYQRNTLITQELERVLSMAMAANGGFTLPVFLPKQWHMIRGLERTK